MISKNKITQLLILVLGLVLGFLASQYYIHRHVLSHFPPPPPRHMENHIIELFKDKLNLSKDQMASIQPIVDRTHQALEKIHEEQRPQIDEIMKMHNEEIESFLSDEQKVKFRDLMNKMKRPPHRGPDKPKEFH